MLIQDHQPLIFSLLDDLKYALHEINHKHG